MEYRKRIDALTVNDVIWTPYTVHIVDKGDEEFDDVIPFLVICNRKG